ncbi:glycosyltransferase family 2 protein [Ectobacillus ponti]|uniref:Glycosyltransferase n=1 Tax=Ectobacillus ponti TaxID=2961894 RepID=A0AA42BNT8_9BACI|nr:glycosyltransferase family 2 protein [Ectobacillus ponti]MCP8968350.1 glycosyltransferase [Ectobacillus ponti]
MGIEMSVIMNSYNKYPQCLYSLYAIEGQTFDLSKVEVIFVDDTSTDETPILREYEPPFQFKYLRPASNLGRSKAKNFGLEHAQGNIIVMLDAEVLLSPTFLAEHYAYHQAAEPVCVATCFHHRSAYTVYEDTFQPQQKREFFRFVDRHKAMLPRHIQFALKRKVGRGINTGKVEFLEKEDFMLEQYKGLSFPTPFFPEIVKAFGHELNGFSFPWIFAITHALSFTRSQLEAVGQFYEGFQGYGCEDWEFGYRLYKNGVKIIDNPNGCVYHQEHARNPVNDQKEAVSNYYTFYKRHPHFDVGAVALMWVGKDWFFTDQLVKEYARFCQETGERYIELQQAYHTFFSLILEHMIQDKQITRLGQAAQFNENTWQQLYRQKQDAEQTGKYPYLIETMNHLLQL